MAGCRALREGNRNRREQIATRMRDEARASPVPSLAGLDDGGRDGEINRRRERRGSDRLRRGRALVRSAEILRRRDSSSPEARRNHRGLGILLHIVERRLRRRDEPIDGGDAAVLGPESEGVRPERLQNASVPVRERGDRIGRGAGGVGDGAAVLVRRDAEVSEIDGAGDRGEGERRGCNV